MQEQNVLAMQGHQQEEYSKPRGCILKTRVVWTPSCGGKGYMVEEKYKFDSS